MNHPDSSPKRDRTPEQVAKLKQRFEHKKFQLVRIETEKGMSGFGFMTERDGDYLRAAVLMTSSPASAEIEEALDLLMTAYAEPESPKVWVIRGGDALAGREMKTTALQRQIKSQTP